MENDFIHSQDFIIIVNQSLEAAGYMPILNEEVLMEYLLFEGWVDKEGNITEEGIRSGLLIQIPTANRN